MNFTDEEYEGINLKIPYWFYSVNKENLKPILDNLKDFLENKSLSSFHPDNQRNILELDNIESKKQMLLDKIESEKAAKEKREKYNADLLSGNVYEIAWLKRTASESIERGLRLTTKDGQEYKYSEEEILT